MTLYRERNEDKRKGYIEHISQYYRDALVYVDESGVDHCLYKDKGWAPRGLKIHGEIAGKNVLGKMSGYMIILSIM